VVGISVEDPECECGNKDRRRFVYDPERGEVVCKDCGLVKELRFEGKGPSFSQYGILGSTFNPRRNSNPEARYTMMRLKVQNDWTTAKDLRWHYKSKQLCEKANAPNCVHDSIMNFYLGNRKSLQGLRKAETITALIYAYTRQLDLYSTSLGKLCESLGADKSLTLRYLYRFTCDYKLRIARKQPSDYIKIFAPRLRVAQGILQKALTISDHYSRCSGHAESPRSIASASLYLASEGELTQKNVARTCGVAEYTVRDVSRKIREETEHAQG